MTTNKVNRIMVKALRWADNLIDKGVARLDTPEPAPQVSEPTDEPPSFYTEYEAWAAQRERKTKDEPEQ